MVTMYRFCINNKRRGPSAALNQGIPNIVKTDKTLKLYFCDKRFLWFIYMVF